MICVYDIGNTAFEKNGDAVLTPISGSVHQVAGGNYDLTMVHPIDPQGKWKHLVAEAIIRAPIPAETIETAFSGMDADVYRVTTPTAALRSEPNAPTTISYDLWIANRVLKIYAIGDKVTYIDKNYEMTALDPGTDMNYNSPPDNYPEYWREIARTTAGAPILANLKEDAELYYVSGPTNGWYKMCTMYGLEGYIEASAVTYDRHLTPAETAPRRITTQLFRIKSVTVETKNSQVSVTAQHVSYDLNGILVDGLKLKRKQPAEAIAWIVQSLMTEYQGTIATNMASSEDATFTADISGKSGMYALIDPDKGVVPVFDAKFTRDNWDLFVMAKTDTDRGFRITYGNNMLGVNWKTDSGSLVTRVVPVAKAADGSEFYLDNDGEKWIDSELIDDYPVIRMERIRVNGQVGKDDGTETATNWTEETLREEMEKQARARFDVDKVDQLKHDITIDFEMLGSAEEYPQLKGLQQVLLYDRVTAINERIGLSVNVTVSELEYDIIKEKITALKLTNVQGYNGRNVAGFSLANNTITGDKLTDGAKDDVAGAAADAAEGYTDRKATYIMQWVAANYEPLT